MFYLSLSINCFQLTTGYARATLNGFTFPARINILNTIKKRKNNIFDSIS